MRTVAVVTVFSVCEKFLGFLYRIFLSRTIGSEGIGLYQVALSVFALIFTITCSGTPITVSRLMTKYSAENRPDRVRKVITAGLSVTFFTAIPICLLFLLLGKNLGFLFADDRCVSIFLVVIPGLIFTSVYAVLRGVFWGNKDFLPYSAIELLEEICMIISGIILISFASNVYQGAFRAGVAVLISYVFSFTLATIVFFLRKNKFANPKSELRPLLVSAMPVTAMRTASSFASSLISIILPMRLIVSGMSESQAMSAFGAAMGQAIPILFIPTTLIGSFTLVLVPEISENYYKKRHHYLKRDVEKSIKFTFFLTCLFVPVFLVCGKEIGVLIFGGHECGDYLTASSFLMFFMSLSSITTSILNSMGLEHKTLVAFIVSTSFMLLSVWFLPKFMGVYSLIVGFSFVYGLTSILNLILLNKHCAEKPRYVKFLLLSSLLVVPTCLMGLMLEKLFLPILGSLFSFLLTSALMMAFNFLLHVGFGLISFKLIKTRIKSSLRPKKRKLTA